MGAERIAWVYQIDIRTFGVSVFKAWVGTQDGRECFLTPGVDRMTWNTRVVSPTQSGRARWLYGYDSVGVAESREEARSRAVATLRQWNDRLKRDGREVPDALSNALEGLPR